MAWAEKMPGGGKFRGCYRDSAGRRCTVKDDRGRTIHYVRKSDAKSVATAKEVEARRQAAVPETAIAARTTWGAWWDHLAAKRRTDTDTRSTEHYIVEKYLRPRWGDVPLTKITKRALQDWVDEIKVGQSPSYTRRIWGALSSSINAAVDREVLGASPCVGIKLPKVMKRAKPYMDEGHVEALGDKLDEVYQDMTDFDLETGLRPGELCGLHADQLDLDNGWLIATNVYVSRSKVIRPYPKDEDFRRVPMTTRALEIVRRHLEGRDLTGGCGISHSDGAKCRSALLFLSPKGKPVNPRNLAERLRRAAEQAKATHRSPYAGRRGFATWAARGGVDAFELAAIMGHEDIDQTREYVQQTPSARLRLLAARGEIPPLRAVPGASGADDGADPAEMDPEQTDTRGA